MQTHFAYQTAIIDLHERGYSDDFILFGNDLFWVQEKVFIRNYDFCIHECYRFAHPEGKDEDIVVLGIAAVNETIKGILLNHYSFTTNAPLVIISKLRELDVVH